MEFIADPRERALHQILSTAAARLDAGQPEEALKVLQSQAGLALENPVGRNILGEVELALGKPGEALRTFDAAIRMAPQFAEAHANRGAALIDLGRLEEALEAERKAGRLKPGLATAHFNRGIILAKLERLKEAIDAFGAAIKARPDHAEALLNRGVALLQSDRPLDALADFSRAHAADPQMVAVHLGVANAQQALGQWERALAAVERALLMAPGDEKALAVKVKVLVAMDRYAQALPLVEEIVVRSPEDREFLDQQFSVLRGLRRFDDALAVADKVVRLKPDDPDSYAMRSVALSDLNRMEEAYEAIQIAEKLGANNARYHHIRAILMTDLGDLGEAAASYRRALALLPNKPEYHHNHGMMLLANGDFGEGWKEHEWRLRDPQYRGYDRVSSAPRWAGEDLAGKRVLVLHEQGAGDTIQFARFAQELVRRGAGGVTFLVPRPLAGVIRRSLPAIDVTDAMGVRPPFDFQAPVMSLPLLLKTPVEALSADVPYFRADPARVEKWRGRVGAEGFKIGVVWQGNPSYFRDNYRSVPLRTFAPLAALDGVRLVSLQAVNGLDQLASLPAGMRVERYGDEIERNPDGFEEVAALSANMDLIVCSDTGTAHLMGALGRPTWIALRYRPDWRWMYDRSDTPWYPTMRLFRQAQHGDWDGVFAKIAAALRDRMSAIPPG